MLRAVGGVVVVQTLLRELIYGVPPVPVSLTADGNS